MPRNSSLEEIVAVLLDEIHECYQKYTRMDRNIAKTVLCSEMVKLSELQRCHIILTQDDMSQLLQANCSPAAAAGEPASLSRLANHIEMIDAHIHYAKYRHGCWIVACNTYQIYRHECFVTFKLNGADLYNEILASEMQSGADTYMSVPHATLAPEASYMRISKSQHQATIIEYFDDAAPRRMLHNGEGAPAVIINKGNITTLLYYQHGKYLFTRTIEREHA